MRAPLGENKIGTQRLGGKCDCRAGRAGTSDGCTIPLYGYPERPLELVSVLHLDERLSDTPIADLAAWLPQE